MGYGKKEKLIFLVICFVLVFLMYGRTIFGDFVFDDRGLMEHQSALQLGRLPLIFGMPYWTQETGLYRPIVLVSYSLNYAFLGASPWGFHLINLILYALTGYFIFSLAKNIFKNRLLGFLSGLVFLALPIHTEAVANIIGRAEILALFFSLLVFLELSKEKPQPFFVGLWFALALGSKETAVATLPIAFFLVAIKEKRIFSKEVLAKYRFVFYALLAGGAAYFLARYLVLGAGHFLLVETSVVENPLKFAEPLARIATAFKVLSVVYLQKSFWPFELCSDYSYNQIPVLAGFFNAAAMIGASVFIFLVGSCFWFLKRRPVLALGSAFFVFGFLPVANILLSTGTIAGERLAYFPSLGLCLFLAAGLISLVRLKPGRFFVYVFVVASLSLLAFYGWRSFQRAGDWLTEKRLFVSAARCAPQSVLSRSNLGAVYYLAGNLAEAKKELLAAQQIYDGYPKGVNNLGLVYWKEGDEKTARQLFLRALNFRFPYYGAYENLALMALGNGKIEEAKKWLRLFMSNNEQAVESYIKSYFLSKEAP